MRSLLIHIIRTTTIHLFWSDGLTKSSRLVHSFARDWLRKDFTVIGFGLVGWLVPSSVPAINGNSLTGLFFSSIGPELEKFPAGPSVDSPFWSVRTGVVR